VPDRQHFVNGIPEDKQCLNEVVVDTWAGFLFFNMNPEAEPLHEFLGVIPSHLDPYRIEQYHVIDDYVIERNCNWKFAVDQFAEIYHLPALHPQLLEYFDHLATPVDVYDGGKHSRQLIRMGLPDPIWTDELAQRFGYENRDTITNQQRANLRDCGIDPDPLDLKARELPPVLAEARRKWGEEIGMDFSLLVDEQLVDNFPWVMPCKDGHVSFAPFLLDHWWAAVVDMMGSPDWAVSEAFATTMGRVANADVVEPLTVAWLMQHTKQEIYEMALERKVACFPVNTMEEVLESRQYQARDFFVDVAHPVAGTLRQPGAAGAYSDTPWAVRRPVPLLGEHTTAVICGELGHSEAELAALVAAGVCATSTADSA